MTTLPHIQELKPKILIKDLLSGARTDAGHDSFDCLPGQPIVTRVPDSSRLRLKELAKDPSRRSLNALMAEIMTYFLQEKPYGKGLKFRIPRFTVRFEHGTPVRTGWRQFNVYIPDDLKEEVMAEIGRLRTGERIFVTPANYTYSGIFWWLSLVEPEGEETHSYYESLKKLHGEWKKEPRIRKKGGRA